MFIKCLLLLFVLSFVEAVPSSCPIPRIKNGRTRARQRGTFLRFSCGSQYTLVGNKYAICRFGQWDVPIPVCVKTGCQELEEVKNAVNMTSHNNAWVVFFCLSGHQLVGSPVIYCDGTQWNSTAPGCYGSTSKKSETECDFEGSNICGWKSDEYHDFDWRRLNKKTPSSFLQTGPQYDHTYGKNGSGYYMYIETTGRIANETARLMSPVYEADLANDGCFVFWYHMFGKSMGGLVVYQKPDKLSMYQLEALHLHKKAQNYTLFEQWGDQGNEWYSALAMLSDVGDNFQIVIEGIRGESFMSGIAIDDVSIKNGENCTKAMNQATTPPTVLHGCEEGICRRDQECVNQLGHFDCKPKTDHREETETNRTAPAETQPKKPSITTTSTPKSTPQPTTTSTTTERSSGLFYNNAVGPRYKNVDANGRDLADLGPYITHVYNEVSDRYATPKSEPPPTTVEPEEQTYLIPTEHQYITVIEPVYTPKQPEVTFNQPTLPAYIPETDLPKQPENQPEPTPKQEEQPEPTPKQEDQTNQNKGRPVTVAGDKKEDGSVIVNTQQHPKNQWTNVIKPKECPFGFEPDEYGSCFDIDECATNRHSCSGLTEVCRNTIGGYTCNCAPGFRRIIYTCVLITTSSCRGTRFILNKTASVLYDVYLEID